VGGDEAVAQFGQRGIGLLGDLVAEGLKVGCEGALSATRVGLRRAAPTAAPSLPEFLNKRAADTKALRNRALRRGTSFQCLDDTIP
jgi:hypothetical protein